MYILNTCVYSLIIIISAIIKVDAIEKKVIQCRNENCTEPIWNTNAATFIFKNGTVLKKKNDAVAVYGYSKSESLLRENGTCEFVQSGQLYKPKYRHVKLVNVTWNHEICSIPKTSSVKNANNAVGNHGHQSEFGEKHNIQKIEIYPKSTRFGLYMELFENSTRKYELHIENKKIATSSIDHFPDANWEKRDKFGSLQISDNISVIDVNAKSDITDEIGSVLDNKVNLKTNYLLNNFVDNKSEPDISPTYSGSNLQNDSMDAKSPLYNASSGIESSDISNVTPTEVTNESDIQINNVPILNANISPQTEKPNESEQKISGTTDGQTEYSIKSSLYNVLAGTESRDALGDTSNVSAEVTNKNETEISSDPVLNFDIPQPAKSSGSDTLQTNNRINWQTDYYSASEKNVVPKIESSDAVTSDDSTSVGELNTIPDDENVTETSVDRTSSENIIVNEMDITSEASSAYEFKGVEHENVVIGSQHTMNDTDDSFGFTFYYWMDEVEAHLYSFLSSVYLLWENVVMKWNEILVIIKYNARQDSEHVSSAVANQFETCPAPNTINQVYDDNIVDGCCNDESCTEKKNQMRSSQQEFPSSNVGSAWIDDSSLISWNYYCYTAFVTFIVFLCSVLYYSLQKRSLDYKLVTRINKLESHLFVLNKEIVSLEEKNRETIVNQKHIDGDNFVPHDVDPNYEGDSFEILQSSNVQLVKKVTYLEGELEGVTSSALQIHQLLEKALSEQQDSRVLEERIQDLIKDGQKQCEIVDSLKRENENLTLENELLKEDNNEMIKRVEKLRAEYNVEQRQNKELTEQSESLQSRLNEQMEIFSTNEEKYKHEIAQLRKTVCNLELSLKKSEINLEKLKHLTQNKDLDGWEHEDDDMEVKSQLADLQTLQSYDENLREELSAEKSARMSLEDTVQQLNSQLDKLREKWDSLENEKKSLDVKLQVLTGYFNEKENVFRKEMEIKDATWSQQQNDQLLLSHKFSLLQAELDTVKNQNEELKNEILDQEKSFKTQLANAEEKSRERWFALRQAERKYKECEQEAAALRNKLLMLENNMTTSSSKNETPVSNAGNLVNGIASNGLPSEFYPGNVAAIPSDLFNSSEFIPLPPLPLPNHDVEIFPPEPLYSPERLSPLGGAAAGRRPLSPPPPLIDDEDDFLTEDFSRRSRNNTTANTLDSISSLSTYRSTPPLGGRRKNQYRTRHRNMDQDSLSSGLSETSLDKEIRR